MVEESQKTGSFFLPPKPPTLVRKHESLAINPVYIPIDNDNCAHGLPIEIPFIWILNADHTLILGVEKPWLYPKHFLADEKTLMQLEDHAKTQLLVEISEEDGDEAQKELSRSMIDKKLGFGHATLSHVFMDNGEISTTIPGGAYIAGELVYDKTNEKWILNNKSGRFYQVQGKNREGIDYLLKHVAKKLHEKLNIDIIISILESKLEPTTLWKKTEKKESDLYEKMFSLIEKIFKHTYTDQNKKEIIKKKLEKAKGNISDCITPIYQAIFYFCQLAREEKNEETKRELITHIKYMIQHREDIRASLKKSKLLKIDIETFAQPTEREFSSKKSHRLFQVIANKRNCPASELGNNRYALLYGHDRMPPMPT